MAPNNRLIPHVLYSQSNFITIVSVFAKTDLEDNIL